MIISVLDYSKNILQDTSQDPEAHDTANLFFHFLHWVHFLARGDGCFRASPTMSFSDDTYNTTSFGYDKSSLNESDDDEEPLSWRLDPDESMSDWTIIILHDDSGTEDVYHVHKNMLAVGPCKSDYFASVFRSSQLQESQTSTSRIPLADQAATAIPKLLDFVYSKKLDITAPLAGSLRYLSQYFGMKLLHRRVMEFIRVDMDMANVDVYIQDAITFHDEHMMFLAGDLIVRNIRHLKPTSPLLETVDPDFFLQIIASPDMDTCGVSCHLSNLVAAYCQIHRREMSSEMFDALTDRKQLPLIDKNAALIFLEIESGVRTNECAEVSCLQKRCIQVLAHNWKDYCSLTTTSPIRGFSSPVLVEFIQKTLTIASQGHDKILRQVESEITSQVFDLQTRLTDAVDHAQQRLKRAEQDKRDLLYEVSRLQDAVSEKDRQIVHYQREWSKLHRVPASHSFRDSRICTYHHQSEAEPFDNPGPSQFGKTRPTGMPQIGDLPEDGYLYLQKNGNQFDRWPVLYYRDE